MQPFTVIEGIAAPLPAANVDTDVIMPKQFLKGVDRSGLKEGTFAALRYGPDGAPRADFVLNRDPWRAAAFLVVGENFGCGSSREHAVWGLSQNGIRALIGTSFAGIFFDNCARNGLLAITLPADDVAALLAGAGDPDTCRIAIDLPNQIISASGLSLRFEIEATRKEALVFGLDAIGTTLQARADIAAFESAYLKDNPWLA
ncbi:3-isopropylmalate dehydratase small subunit [Roseixanthobacter glucoisosaccharinicivorans]|uniref:3-isopropylmalate dehydratase small subunit n=1 Tax=Roseixanthobacter glucoisosaccharinicivorans TaxID=3119923 RepID=UPI0037291527